MASLARLKTVSSLYFQCAATPYSARRCMSQVRICSSTDLPPGPDDRRVQRLVHVELRHRDVVLEPSGDGVPPRVDDAERRVAVLDRIDQDADAHQVVDVVEADVPGDHLLVDRVVVLGTAGDLRVDLGLAQVGADVLDHFLQERLAPRRPVGHQADDLVEPLGVQGREGEVLELPLHRVHAEAVGERGEDLQGLPGLALLLLPGQVAQRPHVVQPVGELDHQHPDVAGHRDHHLADGLRLGGLAVLDLVQLGDAVDQRRRCPRRTRCAARSACRECPPPCRAAARRRSSRCSCRARPGSSPPRAGG